MTPPVPKLGLRSGHFEWQLARRLDGLGDGEVMMVDMKLASRDGLTEFQQHNRGPRQVSV